MTLFLKMEPVAGAHIDDVAFYMCETATRLQLGIKVHFNGVELVAYPNHQPYALSDGFQKAVKEKGEDKMAFSAP